MRMLFLVNFQYLQHKIDSVVHLAALKAVGPSMKNPFLYYKNNLIGTVNLIDVRDI